MRRAATQARRTAAIAAASLLTAALAAACVEVNINGGGLQADLEGAVYLTENTESGEARLEGGEFRAPAAPGSAAELVIRLGKWAGGDLDGDGLPDAAAITIEDPGGSGSFRYLHALTREGGGWRAAASAFLGDRVRVEGVSIHDGAIVVAMLGRRPDEPFSAPPTVPAIRRFTLAGGALVEER